MARWTLKVLLSHGAKVNAVEPYKGQTALMWAAGEGNTPAVGIWSSLARMKAKSKRIHAAAIRRPEQPDPHDQDAAGTRRER
jgi:hypothetical protein